MRHQAATRRILIVGISLVFVFLGTVRPAGAADLLSVSDYLGRQQGNLTSGVTHYVFFTPATTIPTPGNNVRLVFPSSTPGTWCRVAGADLSVSGVTDPDGASENATPLFGSLVGTCSIGNGTTTFDTIIVTNVAALNAGTKYGVVITDPGTAKLGTPPPAISINESIFINNGLSDIDSLDFFAVTIPNDQVMIAATVVATPPNDTNPAVEFIGLAASSGQVRISRDGVSLASTPADTGASFDVALTDQPVGQHIYSIGGTDRDGRSLTAVTFALNLGVNTSTTISGIFLGPSIVVTTPIVTVGGQVILAGSTAPLSSVTATVTTTTQSKNYTVIADNTGNWSLAINSTDLGVGHHDASVRAEFTDGTFSQFSATVTFTVNPLSGPPPTSPPAPVPPGPIPLPLVIFADLNHDGRVNLIDFSIVLYFWHSNDPRGDVNHDGRVDIIDFSIMLFHWTN